MRVARTSKGKIMTDEGDDEVAAVQDPSSTATLSKMTLSEIEHAIDVLPAQLSHDEVLHWLLLATTLLQRAKEVKQRVDAEAIAWIGRHGALKNGPTVYNVVKHRQVRCSNAVECIELLLQACGGDLDALCGYLRADAFRYGACSDILPPQQFRKVFKEEWKDRLILRAIDTRYVSRPVRANEESRG